MIEIRGNERRGYGRDNTTELFISLYLILFGFFVLLEATSEKKNDRAVVAVDSVRSAFSTPDRESALPKKGEDRAQEFLANIQGLFNQEFAIKGETGSAGGGYFRAQIPIDALFSGGALELRSAKRPFMDKLASLVGGTVTVGGKGSISFLIGQKPFNDKWVSEVSQNFLAIKRGGAVARYLTQKGVQHDQFVIGLGDHNPDFITVVVRFQRQSEQKSPLENWQITESLNG